VGFTTYTGTVSAASRWGGLRETMSINPGLPESYEQLMHEVAMRTEQTPLPNFQLIMRSNADGPSTASMPQSGALSVLRNPERLERAIGVQYVKRTERWSHYFRALLPSQFDALMHFDTTHALQPLIAQPEVEWREEQKAMDAGAKPVPSEDESEEEEEMMG
jgi:erythromycin esterase-like protein